jgi:hypothetical protein
MCPEPTMRTRRSYSILLLLALASALAASCNRSTTGVGRARSPNARTSADSPPASGAAMASGQPFSALLGSTDVHDTSGAPMRVCSGSTETTKTAWVPSFDDKGSPIPNQIKVHVDTSRCGFASTPYYFPRLNCTKVCGAAIGGDSASGTVPSGFDVHVTNTTAQKWAPSDANAPTNGWHIEWIAIGHQS